MVACQIIIRTVNGVAPSGSTQPTRLRVTGLAFGCPGGVLLTSNLTAPMTAPAAVDGNGRFLVDIPLVGTVNCGDQIGVTVTCAANPNCYATRQSEPLLCCSVRIVTVDGIVPQGSLAPSAIRVLGTMYGCASDQVTISAPGVTAPRTVAVDPVTGNFAEQLPITTGGFLCGTPVKVIAQCVGSAIGCQDAVDVKQLPCPQCFRGQVTAMVGPCSGTPALATVSLNAQIGLSANGSAQFEWVFGDGTLNQPFTVTIPSGAPGAFATANTTHSYPAGTYTVEVRRVDVGECPPVQVTFTVDCDRCPAVSVSVVVGDCEPTVSAGEARPVTYTVSFSPPLGAGDTATVVFSYGGADVNGVSTATRSQTGPMPVLQTTHLQHRAGGYASMAFVTVTDQSGVVLCTPATRQVTFTTRPPGAPAGVDVDPCLPCPTAVQVLVSQPAALPQPHRQFEARVVWPNAAPPPPPPVPAAYDWTVTLPDGRQAKIAGGSATVTTLATSAWTGNGSSTGAVDLVTGGSYGVSVTAKYATTAGLPTDPMTGVPTCNLTGAGTFPVAGPPPVCPSVTGVSVLTPACADETQQLPAALTFTATVQNANLVTGPFIWDFGDPTSPSNTAQTSAPTAQHTYPRPGAYTITATVPATAACPSSTAQGTVTIGQCPCPPGQVRDPSGNCVPPTTPTTPPSSALCCALIWIWLVLSVIFNLLLFYSVYSYWPVGTIIVIVVGGLATIAFIAWIILCCWPCALTFWRCCVLWQWQWVMVSISVLIMSLLMAASKFFPVLAGNPTVLFIYGGYVLVVLGVLSAIGNCGRLPNPTDPRTYPPCCCPGSACP